MQEPFGAILKRLRIRAGLTISELAEAVGAERSSIRAWEQGKRVPRDRARLDDLAQVLQLSPTETTTLATAARSQRDIGVVLAPQTQAEVETTNSSVLPDAPLSCHQLRAPVQDFVGRTLEIATLRAALLRASEGGSPIAITGVQGMGGIGKTELAYRVAHETRDGFPDAQLVLSLRGTSTTPLPAQQALQRVIHAFTPDAKLPDDLPTLETLYRSQLANRRILILADDAHSASQVEPLLPPAGSALLITSRTRFTLPAMTTIDLEQLSPQEALLLLHSIYPRLREEQAAALARACGYLPLALRISASLLRTTPALVVAEYLAQLADERQRLFLLRDPDHPQRDVEATLALSYTLLDSAAQAVFRQLGVFVADFAAELAQAVVTVPEGANLTVILHLLLRRNLVLYNAEQARWRLHDLVRDLAWQRLEAAEETKATMWRYAQATVALATRIQDMYLAGGDQMILALVQFDAERPHVEAAHGWAIAQMKTPEGDQLLFDTAQATRFIERFRYDWQEIIPLWEDVRMAARRLGNRLEEGRVLGRLGVCYAHLSESPKAISYYTEALAIARETGDRRGEGITLGNLGNIYRNTGEPSKAIIYYEQDLTIARAIGDRRGEGITLGNLGTAYGELGELAKVIACLLQYLAIAREIGDRRGEGIALRNLGIVYKDLGEPSKAISYSEQALAIAREFGSREDESIALHHLGNACIEQGDTRRAIACCMEARSIAHAVGNRRGEGYALSYLTRAQALRGDMTQAGTTYTQAVTCFRDARDRWGEAECHWLFGLALAQRGKYDQALPLLHAAVAYEQEIKHVKAAEHAMLLARLEEGQELPAELHVPTNQHAIGGN